MSVTIMRSYVKTAYTGKDWFKRVEGMTDDQIIAIYYRLLRSGKLQTK